MRPCWCVHPRLTPAEARAGSARFLTYSVTVLTLTLMIVQEANELQQQKVAEAAHLEGTNTLLEAHVEGLEAQLLQLQLEAEGSAQGTPSGPSPTPSPTSAAAKQRLKTRQQMRESEMSRV